MNKHDLINSYEEYEIYQNELEYRIEENNELPKNEQLTINELKEIVYNGDCLTWAWDNFINLFQEDIDNIMKRYKLKGYWLVNGFKLGWRNKTGFTYVKTNKIIELLRKILPNTDVTLKVYKHNRNQIRIICYHHDNPTGETYVLKHLTGKEIERIERQEYFN